MNIVLGVTGSIAAYKACELVRLFTKAGHNVDVVMTPNATRFVTPLTFRTLSRNPVALDMFETTSEWKPGHISLAEKADAMVVAPATANILAKMARGIADDYLSSLLLATRKPVFAAPAMNTGMWENPATQENLGILAARGVKIIAPASGELACAASGPGRLADPAEIFKTVCAAL